MPNPITWVRQKIKQLYAWTAKWAQHKNAEKALAGITFAEASFFPIPPDPLLIAMVFTKTNRWVRYALVTTIASIVGGVLGYIIGWGLFESIGDWIINTYHLESEYDSLAQSFADNAFIAVLAAALTPIPYKIITLTAGALHVNFAAFMFASIIGRSLRFFAVAAAAHFLGKRYKDQIEKYIDIISLVLIGLVVAILLVLR